MSRRASLPGAEELFRKTTAPDQPAASPSAPVDKEISQQVDVAGTDEARRGPKHAEKVTFYCTAEDLMALEQARLRLRAEHGVAADRGRIVRAALHYVLEDFEARTEDSILLRRLQS